MSSNNKKTIRVLFPQWQGGNQGIYSFGSELLEWLSPKTDSNLFKINVPAYVAEPGEPEQGIIFRTQLNKQLEQAHTLFEEEQPDKIVIFGGDCLVDQAPFAWLNEKYNGTLGVLWIDSHPDVKTPDDYTHAHTMVLGNLLGEGDSAFSSRVKVPLKPENVMYAGLREEGLTEQEKEVILRLGLKNAKPESLYENSQEIIDWIHANKITKLAIHFDLDVLNPDIFRSVLFSEPEPEIDWKAIYPVGKLKLDHVMRVIKDVSITTEVVALGITEHLPWDAWNLKNALHSIPIMNE